MKLPKGPNPPGKSAATVKIGERGQIVIPKDMRDMLGYVPGDTLLLLCDKKRGLAVPTREQSSKIYSRIFGALDETEEEQA